MKLNPLFSALCLIGLMVTLLMACSKEDLVQDNLDVKVISLTEGSATFSALGIKQDKETSWLYGICWACDSLPTMVSNNKLGQYVNGVFQCFLDRLKPGNTYHARLFAKKNDEVVYGPDVSFKTVSLTLCPAVFNYATINSVNLSFEFKLSKGKVSINKFGYCWSKLPSPLLMTDSCVSFMPWLSDEGWPGGLYGLTLKGLLPNEAYHVRAFATNPTDTFYGTDFVVKTLPVSGTVTDIDGNLYHFKAMGSAVWMLENLQVTHYRDGTPIPRVSISSQWGALKTGAYTLYGDKDENAPIYGCLYNYYAVANSKGLAPEGWHVATYNEWASLVYANGGTQKAGANLKEVGTAHWTPPNADATNSTGFTALPGGYYSSSFSGGSYLYEGLGDYACWWTSTWYKEGSSWAVFMFYQDSWALAMNIGHDSGMSVRCVKD